MKKQVHVRIDENIIEQIKQLSDLEDRTIQDIIQGCVMSMLEEKKKRKRNSSGEFTFIDLFAGIGGIRLAFEKQGGHCVFSCEWNKYCKETYFENFGEIPVGNIREVAAEDIPIHDILTGGFPCQPFSIAGVSKKQSLGRETGFRDKTQGTLFFDICRIIENRRPKAFLLENVKNLKSHDKGNTWKVIKTTLEDLNYNVFDCVLDGKGFVPQHRERIFIVGFDRNRYGNVDFEFDLKYPEQQPVLRDILEEEVEIKYTLSDKLWEYLQNYAEKHRAKGNGFGYGMPDLDGTTRTLSARYYKDGSEILINQGDGKNPRRLTPRECARLQGFGDDFIIPVSDTQAYKQFGNSVAVPLVTEIASLVVTRLEALESEIYSPIGLK